MIIRHKLNLSLIIIHIGRQLRKAILCGSIYLLSNGIRMEHTSCRSICVSPKANIAMKGNFLAPDSYDTPVVLSIALLLLTYLFSLQFLIFHLLTEWFQCCCVTFLCYFSFPAAWIWLVILDFGKPLIENINAWCSVKANSILPLQTFIDWYKGKNLHTTQCYIELYRLHGPTADFLLFSKKKTATCIQAYTCGLYSSISNARSSAFQASIITHLNQ